MSSNTGTIAQIFGPVVDVRFPAGKLPPINTALHLVDPQREIDVVLEVSQHLGNDVARCVAMSTTDGCRRGMSVADTGAPKRVYSPEAMEVLVSSPWPGNVRQLFNVVEQNVALAPGRVISGALVRRSLGEVGGGLPSFDEARADFTRTYLRQVLEMAGGNISRAARLAGRNRTDLYKLLHRHGISPSEFKGNKATTH